MVKRFLDSPKSTKRVSSSFSVKPFSTAVRRGTEAQTEPENQSVPSCAAGSACRLKVGGKGGGRGHVDAGQDRDAGQDGHSQRTALGTDSVDMAGSWVGVKRRMRNRLANDIAHSCSSTPTTRSRRITHERGYTYLSRARLAHSVPTRAVSSRASTRLPRAPLLSDSRTPAEYRDWLLTYARLLRRTSPLACTHSPARRAARDHDTAVFRSGGPSPLKIASAHLSSVARIGTAP